MGFLNAFRGKGSNDAMRQTTSLTMAYLLEQNTCFEAYMRQKVEELEARVAAQQARVSIVEAAPPLEADEGQFLAADVADEDTLADQSDTFVDLNQVGADFVLDEETGPETEESDLAGNQPAAVIAPAVVAPPFTTDEWGSWEEALLGGKPDEATAEESPASESTSEVEADSKGQQGVPATTDETGQIASPPQQATDQSAEAEEDETWPALPETAGPVESWA